MLDAIRGTLKSQPPGYRFNTNCYDIFQTIFVSAGELHFECFDTDHESKSILIPGQFLVLRKNSKFTLSSPHTGYGGICYRDLSPLQDEQVGFSFCSHGTHWLVEMVGLLQFSLLHPQNFHHNTIDLMGKIIAKQALFEGLTSKQDPNQISSAYWSDQIKQVIQNSLYRSHKEYYEQIHSLNLSYRQLSRHFMQETGLSIKSYQEKERIREAKRLLQGTGFSITDIAYELHYASSQKFAAQFRKATGITATEYRNSQ